MKSIIQKINTIRGAPRFLNDIASTLEPIKWSIKNKDVILSASQKTQFENLTKLIETVKQEVAKLGDIEKIVADFIQKNAPKAKI